MAQKDGILKVKMTHSTYFVDVNKAIYIIVKNDKILFYWVVPTSIILISNIILSLFAR